MPSFRENLRSGRLRAARGQIPAVVPLVCRVLPQVAVAVRVKATTQYPFAISERESHLSMLLECLGDSASAGGMSALARFLYCPWKLFVVGMASWVALRAALDGCAWLGWPGLALCLTLFLVGVGFASCLLAVLDLQRPLGRQWRRLLAAFACWAVVGLDCLCLF